MVIPPEKGRSMKRFKKILALVITMAMVLSMMSMAAFADPSDPPTGGGEGGDTPPAETETVAYDKPLTVTGLMEGDTVTFYQVIEWVGETDDDSDVSGWRAIAPYDSILTQDKLIEVLVGTKAGVDPETGDEVPAKPATGITSELAGQLAALAGDDGVDGVVEGDTATLENAAAGMWMALVTPADANTIYNPVFVSADYYPEDGGTVAMSDSYNGDAVAKKSTLTLEKTAETTEDSWDDDSSDTTAIGDTVTFTVTTTIPGYGGVYTNPYFAVTDSLTNLELDTDSIEVTPATYTTEDEEEADTYEVTSADEGGYTITFAEDYLKTLKTGTEVTITYNAIVTSDAANAVNQEDNQVYIEYSHNPNDQDDYDVKKDTTQHYTFSLDAEGIGEGESETIQGKKTSEVVKIGVDAAGNPITSTTYTSEIGDPEVDKWTGPLEGAVFGLFTDEDGEVPYIPKKADGTAGDEPLTATTGADGRMNFAGLDAGTYYLKEISAPAGYVTNSDPVEVVISAVTEEVEVTEWWTGSAWVSEDPGNDAKSVTYKTDILKEYTVTIGGQETAKYTFTNNTTPNSTEIQWDEAELVEHPYAFENIQGVELPSTGGIGTTIFYIVGSVLVIGAGVVLITRRRMNAQ